MAEGGHSEAILGAAGKSISILTNVSDYDKCVYLPAVSMTRACLP